MRVAAAMSLPHVKQWAKIAKARGSDGGSSRRPAKIWPRRLSNSIRCERDMPHSSRHNSIRANKHTHQCKSNTHSWPCGRLHRWQSRRHFQPPTPAWASSTSQIDSNCRTARQSCPPAVPASSGSSNVADGQKRRGQIHLMHSQAAASDNDPSGLGGLQRAQHHEDDNAAIWHGFYAKF